MILHSKLKVCQCNGDKSRYNDEDDEDNEKNAVDGIDFVTPNTGENIIELNIDRTEWEETCHAHLSPHRRNQLAEGTLFIGCFCPSISYGHASVCTLVGLTTIPVKEFLLNGAPIEIAILGI